MDSDLFDPEYIAARNEALLRQGGYVDVDDTDPKAPSGHAYGIHTSTRLTTYYRQTHRKQAMDVTPQQVIDCLNAAGVKDWLLMGLHGYVGYLPMPRATQAVDVMVPQSQKTRRRRQWGVHLALAGLAVKPCGSVDSADSCYTFQS